MCMTYIGVISVLIKVLLMRNNLDIFIRIRLRYEWKATKWPKPMTFPCVATASNTWQQVMFALGLITPSPCNIKVNSLHSQCWTYHYSHYPASKWLLLSIQSQPLGSVNNRYDHSLAYHIRKTVGNDWTDEYLFQEEHYPQKVQ